MEEKVMLVDVSKCTACRACQVACKQWNRLPAEKTEQMGTHQNPPDLTWATWNLIRFTEVTSKEGSMKWLFPRGACLHCTFCGSDILHPWIGVNEQFEPVIVTAE